MSLNKKKTPWPTKKAMKQVYEMKLWGTNGSSFYSGEGSYNIKIVEPYLKEVKEIGQKCNFFFMLGEFAYI